MTKQNIFRLILVLIPLIILILLEAILRLIGYGHDLSIVATINRNDKNYYTMNQLVGNRYFDENRLFYRKGSHDYFEVNKSSNTVRLFCFGASTTAGFPYEYNAIPSEFLRDRLIDALPGKNVEVINTAIAATNSYTVAEFVNELRSYKPDLFIIYMGQNEFYGAFGIGSTISIGGSRWLIKSYLWMQQFKTFQLIRSIISSISNYFKAPNDEEDKLLMEQMVENKSIKFHGREYNTAKNSFKDNYKEIIDRAIENKIPVIISTLVTNENDLPPFVSMHSDDLKDSQKSRWNDYYNSGLTLIKDKNYKSALNYFEEALSIDSLPADIHYQIGNCYYNLKNYREAENQYNLAKNLDGLRFRAPSEFNEIIKEMASEYKVPLSDVNKNFKQNSPHEIIGNELLVDHVHPNIRGYFLLAKTWFQTIKNNHLIGLSPALTENDSLLWQQSSVTSLDSLIGKIKIMKLKSRPPFSPVDSEFVFKPTNSNEQIAYNYVTGNQVSWGMAHVLAAKEYLGKNELENALKEYKAILITDDTNTNLLSIIGDIYYQLKLYSDADDSYKKAFLLEDNQYLRYRLGLTNINLKKPERALQYLNSCLRDRNYSSRQFSPSEIENIHYNIALAYYQMDDNNKALEELSEVLKVNPSNKDALTLLKEINKKNNR